MAHCEPIRWAPGMRPCASRAWMRRADTPWRLAYWVGVRRCISNNLGGGWVGGGPFGPRFEWLGIYASRLVWIDATNDAAEKITQFLARKMASDAHEPISVPLRGVVLVRRSVGPLDIDASAGARSIGCVAPAVAVIVEFIEHVQPEPRLPTRGIQQRFNAPVAELIRRRCGKLMRPAAAVGQPQLERDGRFVDHALLSVAAGHLAAELELEGVPFVDR